MEFIASADTAALLWVQEHLRVPAVTAVMRVVTHLGDAGAVWLALCAALIIFKRTRRAGICAVVSLTAAYVLNDIILKNIFCRPRPFEAAEAVTALIAHPGGASFPSGHTASSFAAAAAVAVAGAPRYISVPAFALAVLIAFSRVYLGVHYPCDVIAGAAVGAAAGALCAMQIKKRRRHK